MLPAILLLLYVVFHQCFNRAALFVDHCIGVPELHFWILTPTNSGFPPPNAKPVLEEPFSQLATEELLRKARTALIDSTQGKDVRAALSDLN